MREYDGGPGQRVVQASGNELLLSWRRSAVVGLSFRVLLEGGQVQSRKRMRVFSYELRVTALYLRAQCVRRRLS